MLENDLNDRQAVTLLIAVASLVGGMRMESSELIRYSTRAADKILSLESTGDIE